MRGREREGGEREGVVGEGEEEEEGDGEEGVESCFPLSALEIMHSSWRVEKGQGL